MRGTRPSSAKHPNLTRAETTGSYHQRPFSATAPRQEEDGGQVIERSQVGHLDPEDLAATGETSGPGFFHSAKVSFKDEFP